MFLEETLKVRERNVSAVRCRGTDRVSSVVCCRLRFGALRWPFISSMAIQPVVEDKHYSLPITHINDKSNQLAAGNSTSVAIKHLETPKL